MEETIPGKYYAYLSILLGVYFFLSIFVPSLALWAAKLFDFENSIISTVVVVLIAYPVFLLLVGVFVLTGSYEARRFGIFAYKMVMDLLITVIILIPLTPVLFLVAIELKLAILGYGYLFPSLIFSGVYSLVTGIRQLNT